MKILFAILYLTINFSKSFAAFEFKLEDLDPLKPEMNFDQKNLKTGKVTELLSEESKQIIAFDFKLPTMFLPTTLQIEKGIIQDLYVRFPNNYSHDDLLKTLQDKFKKQQRYYKIPNNALYVWNNVDFQGKMINIIYHGSCSFTCFPMGLHLISTTASQNPSFVSLYQKFNKDFPKAP